MDRCPGETAEISTLVKRLGNKLAKCKAELEQAELVILQAQESYDRAKEAYEQLRNQHVSDQQGATAA
jgi:hypothetical protein